MKLIAAAFCFCMLALFGVISIGSSDLNSNGRIEAVSPYRSPMTSEPTRGGSIDQAVLHVLARGQDGLLYHKMRTGGVWSNWQSIPVPTIGITTDSPIAVTETDGSLDIFVRGNDHALWTITLQPSGAAGDWQNLGGVLTSGPAAALAKPR